MRRALTRAVVRAGAPPPVGAPAAVQPHASLLAQLRAAGQPAWAEESRRKYEEDQRRRAARKKQVEREEDKTGNDEDLGDHMVQDPSDELPVVEDDGWLLFQSHDSYPLGVCETWNPSEDDVMGAGLRSVEQAKFHCTKMGYGGFIQKWSLIYFFKVHPPRRLVAAREHCKKEDRGMFHLYVAPELDGVPTLHGDLLQRYDDAVARGEKPEKRDDYPDIDDDLGGFDDLPNEGPGSSGDDSAFSDLMGEMGETSHSSAGEDGIPAAAGGAADGADRSLRDEGHLHPDDLADPLGLQGGELLRDVAEAEAASGLGDAAGVGAAAAVAAAAAASVPRGGGEAGLPQSGAAAAAESAASPAGGVEPSVPQSQSDVPPMTAVRSTRDIKVKGSLAIPAGTEGIVVGPAASGDPQRVHVKFARREGGGNPNLNVRLKEIEKH